MKKTVHALLLFFALTAKISAEGKNSSAEKIRAILSSMNREEKISQIFLVNVEGNEKFSPVEFHADGTPVLPGGVLLFSYNIGETAAKTKSFLNSVNDFYGKNSAVLPYVALDQEGGSVSRLRGITDYLPSQKKIAENFSPERAKEIYSVQARQMKSLGISLNLAPVAEVSVPSNEHFLQNRSFGFVGETVAYSMACILAYEENGVGVAVKHFPGNTNTDPHTGLPEIGLSASDVEKFFLLPFAFVLKANPSCVLMSHARVSSMDSSPAALSDFWVEKILRGRMKFTGLVISDDIFMGALSDNGFPPEVAAIRAVESGVDVIMLSEKKFWSVAEILLARAEENQDFAKKLLDAEKKVIEFKIRKGILK
jgi:beta-N-acetylhexosaminidase